MKMEAAVMTETTRKLAYKVSFNTIIGNVVLSAIKLAAGFLGNSIAMLSDAVHSLSDVFSTLIVLVGIKLAGKKADKSHPYGHERFECVAAIVLAAVLCFTGVWIGYSGIAKISERLNSELAVPGILALAAAGLSIAVKEGMYWYTRSAAKKINSSALMADAWHHRSDAFSSVGSLLGILGARIGFPILDPIASLVICLLIFKASYDIFTDAIGKMTDKACDDQTVDQIRTLILQHDNVASIDLLHTRQFGDKIYVDVEISVDGNATLHTAHEIAHTVHDAIEENIPNVKHCMVHLNPNEPAS